MRHMLGYHLGLPVAVFAALLLVGVPLASAFPIAMMSGCVAMVFMMSGHQHGREHDRARAERDVEDRSR